MTAASDQLMAPPPPMSLSQPVLNASVVPPPRLNEAFVENLKATGIPFSNEAEDRVFRAHGEACWECSGPAGDWVSYRQCV